MKKALIALLLVLPAACSSGGGGGERMSETDFETKVAAILQFDPALLTAGDRAVYLVKRTGDAETQKYTWAAVAEDRGAVWIETSMPFSAGRMVVKTKLERGGKMLEQWVGEPGGVPGQTYPSPRREAPKEVRDSSVAKAETKEEPDRVTVFGKPYDCLRVTTVLVYPDGRKSTMVNWFSKEVPFAVSKSMGGLVKRQFGRLTMELISGDKNGKSELQIPPPEK